MNDIFPSIFFGHGSPMNAIQTNRYTEAWRDFGKRSPRPKTILAISAHWFVGETAVTINTAPRTIHDFGGFPDDLYRVGYPAPGDPALARRVQELLSPLEVVADTSWGLDHGTWSVLRHVYPDADVPIVQLSINASEPAAFHYQLGRALAPLRTENILIAGSGNVVHNLRLYDWSGRGVEKAEWATRFERQAKDLILTGQHAPLIDYPDLGPDAALSIPTPEHYLPLLYILGSQQAGDIINFPVDGIEGGSISMLAVELSGTGN
ncbi:MAG: 4,5-DOPA dioxygenase extradiol [Lysobacterales bacterium]